MWLHFERRGFPKVSLDNLHGLKEHWKLDSTIASLSSTDQDTDLRAGTLNIQIFCTKPFSKKITILFLVCVISYFLLKFFITNQKVQQSKII